MWVCDICGVEVSQSRSGRWIHTDNLDSKIPFHEAKPVSLEGHRARAVKAAQVSAVTEAMIIARNLREEMRDPAKEGIQWTPLAKSVVTLMEEVERLGSNG